MSYNRCTPFATLAPVKTEARNKTDPIYVLLAEASKTKKVLPNGREIRTIWENVVYLRYETTTMVTVSSVVITETVENGVYLCYQTMIMVTVSSVVITDWR